MENENSAISKDDQKLSYIDKINPFNKDITIQISIFLSWLVGGIIILYFILYNSYQNEIVYLLGFFQEKTFALIIGLVFLAIGIFGLFLPISNDFFKKCEVRKEIDRAITHKVNDLLNGEKFSELKDYIDEINFNIQHHALDYKKKEWNGLTKYANSNINLNNILKVVEEYLEEDNKEGANNALWDAFQYIQKYYQFIHPKQFERYNSITKLLQDR